MHQTPTVAFVSIGQTPRPDITADFLQICGSAFRILELGALDDLPTEEIAGLAPRAGESDLIAKLRDGQVVYLSHDRLMPYMQKRIRQAEDARANWIIVACTGDFAELGSTSPLLLPNNILAHSVGSVLKQGDKLTVIVPTEGQIKEATERWSQRGYTVAKVFVEQPFADYHSLIDRLRNDATVQSTQGLIADCFGFGSAFMNAAAKVYQHPIFVSRLLIPHLLLATRSQ